jgi:hypothetical protein
MITVLAVWLAWDALTGAQVDGYRIYYGTTSGQQSIFYDVGNITTGEVKDLPVGIVRAYAGTIESGPSNEVVYVQPTPVGKWVKSRSSISSVSTHSCRSAVTWLYLTLKLCAGEAGAKAGESLVGRIRLFTTENCVGEWGREASSASTAWIEQVGRNENEPHPMSLERFTTVEAAERLTSPRRPMGERKGRHGSRGSITVDPFLNATAGSARAACLEVASG